MKRSSLLSLIGLISITSCFSAEFKNLGFDEVDLNAPGLSGGGRPHGNTLIEWILPHWNVSLGSNTVDTAWLNLDSESGDSIMVGDWISLPTVQGGFALNLNVKTNPPMFQLEQTGTIPANAELLSYRCLGHVMQVRIDGQLIPPLTYPVTSSGRMGVTIEVTNILFDVRQFAGREVKLELVGPILSPTPSIPPSGANVLIDSVTFLSARPSLSVNRSDGGIVLSWPASSIGYVLQVWDLDDPRPIWLDQGTPPVVSGDRQTVTVNRTEGRGKWYRLGISLVYR